MEVKTWTGIAEKKIETQAVRQAQWQTHKVFDRLWTTSYQRTQAYTWLAEKMGLVVKRCHIANFDIVQCQEAIRLVREHQPVFEDRDPSEKRFERRKIEKDANRKFGS